MLYMQHSFTFLKADFSLKLLYKQYNKGYFQQVRQKGFAAAMSEALDKLAEDEVKREADKKNALEATKQAKEMKRNLKRRKWVDWKTQDEEASVDAKRPPFDPADRVKRKKTVILLGYSGANYYGMQRNPGMQTIEEELFRVMQKHKWITDDSYEQAQLSCFQRAARTDKGVSAARQVCSLKLPDELNLQAFNEDLPVDIRLFATKRVTKGFNAKDQCNARTYTYTLPTIAFDEHNATHGVEYEKFRLNAAQFAKLADVLKLYEGTKNFHNFTSRKAFHDPSAKRFIMSFTCSEPFISPHGIEFVTLKVKGQSFMLHQIRKMIGLTIAIVRGQTTIDKLELALSEERIDIPMAPGLGLVLDTVHYERYNDRYGKDGVHEPLTWVAQEQEIQEFIEKFIFANIYKTEATERPMLEWLDTLLRHTYEPRADDAATTTNNKSKDDDDEE